MVLLPRNVAHSFAIDSDQVRALILLTPAGFEGYFKECGVPATTMTLPPPGETSYGEIEKMITVAAKFGVEFLLPNS